MLSPLITTTLRRIARRLPEKSKRRIRAVAAPFEFKRNTSGLTANTDMVSWTRKNPHPVSIVIPSYNDLPYLTKCLESIEATCGGFDYEIIIVDDYCQPENTAALRALENERTRLVLKDERRGFAVSVNMGMAEARHDIVLLNSDIVAQPGWLEALQYSAMAVDEKIGLVSPKLIYPSGRIQYGGTYYARILAPQWFGHLNVGGPATRPSANVATYNRSVSGACVYVTRAAFERLGFLDETFWLGFEDVDWGLRAWDLGIRCYYQPASMLVHHESATRGYSQGARELASMRFFWRRWQHRFLTRTLPAQAPIDFVVSEASGPLWTEYVRSQSEALAAFGYETTVHLLVGGGVDEQIVADLTPRTSVKVCCDWGASETVWLASLEAGVPLYLLPSVESGSFPFDASRQASIIANYKPEFDYIAPNRWTENQLRAEAAWESRRRVVPAVAPRVASDALPPLEAVMVTLGADERTRAIVDEVGAARQFDVRHLPGHEPTAAVADEIISLAPHLVVALGEYENSLAPLVVMGLGTVLLSRHNEKLRYEVLDGYNASLIDVGDRGALRKALEAIISDDVATDELRRNAVASAERYWRLNAREMHRAIQDISEMPV